MAGKIFINYRRGDDAGYSGRLFDRLQEVFEPQRLFMDVDNIAPGLDFVRVLNERIAECDVMLAVIGKHWLDARYASGARRLDNPRDFVRVEIASALNQGKRVIPVLVGDAAMPNERELPDDLRPLVTRNAVRLTHERFRTDTLGLIKALQQSFDEVETERLRLPAERQTSRFRTAPLIAGAVVLLMVGTAAYWFAEKPSPSADRTPTSMTSPAVPAAHSARDPTGLTRALQFELMRVGCFNGVVNGQFDDATKAAWHNFMKLAPSPCPMMCRPTQSRRCAISTTGFAR